MMNEFLAQLYGTNPGSEAIENQAEFEILEKVASSNGIDIEQLSDDELALLYGEVFGNAEPGMDDLEKEAAARFAEADFLGRTMAHSFADEMNKIAVYKGNKTLELGKPIPEGLEGMRQPSLLQRAVSKTRNKGILMSATGKGKATKAIGKFIMNNPKAALGLAAVGGTGLIGAGGYGGYRALKKESSPDDSMIEALAVARATNFLSNYTQDGYNPIAEAVDEVKLANPVLDDIISERAAELLVENGWEHLLQ